MSNKEQLSGDKECLYRQIIVPKEDQFGALESSRLCLRNENSYLALAVPGTAGRSVAGAAMSSPLLSAKMLDALGTTKE